MTDRNLDFIIRAAEWLSSDEDIVAIRAREGPAGRLDRITDLGRRESAMLFSRTVNTVIVPLAVVLIGLFVCLKRRAKTANEKGHSSDV
jgi:hypothetical protein